MYKTALSHDDFNEITMIKNELFFLSKQLNTKTFSHKLIGK